tara:strand:- start:125 stop:907 length:783 start_codon:yes stop_codon:yes gene_type:complete
MFKKITFNYMQIFCSIIIGFIIGYFIFSNDSVVIEKKPLKKGTICLVIDDYGFIFNDMVRNFIELDSNLTVAIIPGSPYATKISDYADSLNNEIIIHMPMESYELEKTNYEIELHEKLNADLVEQKIKMAFEEIPMAIGLNNHQGSKSMENLQLMKNLARSLKKRDKFFLDSYTNPASKGYITMRQFGVPTQLRQVFIDHVEDINTIKYNLDSLINLSHEMDIAVGIAHVKPMTLQVLKIEIPKLEKEGYEFIRLSEAVK